jgi:hypothetical protein
MSEARIDHLETRLDGFEERLRRIEEIVIRIDERLATILPTLATKAELADLRTELAGKPGRLYMWGVIAAMTAAYTAALAAVGVLLTFLPQLHH